MVQHDPRLFFQVAAGLIPALLFGGLLTDRLKPPRGALRTRTHFVLAALVPFLGLAVLQAEVTSISASLAGTPNRLDTWLVSLVLVGLTASALILFIAPWYQRLMAPAGRRLRRFGGGLLTILVIALFVQSARLLTTSVDLEESFQELAALQADDGKNSATAAGSLSAATDQLLSAYDRMYAARAAAGLVSKREAQKVHLCLTDRRFLATFQAQVATLTSKAHPLPAGFEKDLLPGKRIRCSGVLAFP